MRFPAILVVFLLSSCVSVSAKIDGSANFQRVYLDEEKHVCALTQNGKTVFLSGEDKCENPQLAEDGRTVGWTVLERFEPLDVIEPIDLGTKVTVYRNGKGIGTIKGGPFIREWAFWKKGKEVAVYVGGLHFAGAYWLYDLETGKRVAYSQDPVTKESPDWVRNLDPSSRVKSTE